MRLSASNPQASLQPESIQPVLNIGNTHSRYVDACRLKSFTCQKHDVHAASAAYVKSPDTRPLIRTEVTKAELNDLFMRIFRPPLFIPSIPEVRRHVRSPF